MQVQAFAPANISCLFKIVNDPDPRWRGSLGLGFTLDAGVTVGVEKAAQTQIFFNKKSIHFPTVEKVVTTLTKEPIKINITSSLPLGSGFGLSGACSLATAYALNKLLNLKKTNLALAILAHTAEVEKQTGLGDVTNQYFGGLLAKFKPSSHFVVEKIPFTGKPIYCKYFSKLSTEAVLTDAKLKERLNLAADICLTKLQHLLQGQVTLAQILDLSLDFANNSGLLQDKEVLAIIKIIKNQGGHASMIMLGNAVMSDIPFAGATKYLISDTSAHLL